MAELPLNQGITRFKTNEDRFDLFVNGNATTTMQTSGGQLVPTLQKFIADKNAEINTAANGILSQSVAARNAAQQANTDAQGALTQVNTAKGEVFAVAERYWGARSTAPTVEEGAVVGDEYLDVSVTPNVRKNLTSTGWKPTSTVAVAGIRRQDWTATAGQSGPFTVTDGFTTGDVYVNGTLRQTGVTVTPGPTGSFSFQTGLTAGDRVSFRGYYGATEADFYTKPEINDIVNSLDGRLDALESGAVSLDSRLDTAEITLATLKSNGTRALTVSATAPTSGDGSNGDVWYQV